MNKIYKTLVCLPLSLMVFITSCNDTLEVDPTSAITAASFFKTEDDAKGALYGMYIKLRNESSLNIYALGELRSETTTSSIAGSSGYELYYQNTLSPTNPGPASSSWQGLYSIINAANLLIKYIPTTSFTSEENRSNYLAQAYTTRAYIYYVMTRTWGDLPLRTEPLEGVDPQTIQIERSSQADVFSLIKADLDMAIKLFPNTTFPAGRNMWSRAAAYALKADVYLWTGKRLNGGDTDFNTALAACNEVQTADVSLLANYASIFDYSNKGNKEVLMAINYVPNDAVDNYFFNGYIPAAQNVITIDAATKAAYGQPGGNLIWQPSQTLRNQFTSDDTRKNATYLEIFTTNATSGVKTFLTSIIVKGDGTVITGVRYFADDVIIYRYADVVLMKAEAKNALGQDPAVEMNLVRQRAYGTNFADHTFINGSKAANDEAILQERLFELAFEGKRWWDLVRFGKAFEKVPTLQAKIGQNHLLLFPISTVGILNLEPKISQNPGYN